MFISLAQRKSATLTFDYIRTLGRILEDSCDLLFERKVNVTNILASSFDNKEVFEFLRWYIRILSQEIATCLIYWSSAKATSYSWKTPFIKYFLKRKAKVESIQKIIDKCLDIYIAIEYLEERIQGTFPPHEGILIIQERRENPIR